MNPYNRKVTSPVRSSNYGTPPSSRFQDSDTESDGDHAFPKRRTVLHRPYRDSPFRLSSRVIHSPISAATAAAKRGNTESGKEDTPLKQYGEKTGVPKYFFKAGSVKDDWGCTYDKETQQRAKRVKQNDHVNDKNSNVKQKREKDRDVNFPVAQESRATQTEDQVVTKVNEIYPIFHTGGGAGVNSRGDEFQVFNVQNVTYNHCSNILLGGNQSGKCEGAWGDTNW
ncbi:hypothetical protein EJ08DRAFT_724515 [Tothia fuscella]|uniref:Uncharacterized protein n=1 Tax=Tothia fuscella TaxID=1048955 RepID=A0A9P4NJD1_9PEZI|nr:hypothetical protein EJ08DRAFT_724515 [Tothia fuscella]